MRKPIAQRIKELDERKKTLQARLDRQERAQATRRKVLLGSLLLEQLQRNDGQSDDNALRQWLAKELPAFLTQDADIALFADILERRSSTGVPEVQDKTDGEDDGNER
ncbi:mobilization protein [Agrobacterium tumefaciens]|uniref:mobilization protein n=1 Tax=Agrobacterium tumefaciens TaxID=358 RepID=UPI0022433EBA|nr:mobilization protein [Agrobacterium tumefaciens]MCW8061003.1 mobilization protein [Agrobacterium tumefaciens]MCW8147284.1 mobilization protein [Agrobacterium tumefaciens]